jgi:ABC-type nickel/cobalt efflux system permease component RcnA
LEWLFSAQQTIREVLAGEFGKYSAAKEAAIFIWILPLGFVFGAVHALTPGHSKLVLASYVLGSRLSTFRSVTVSIALAFVHVASAVAIALMASWIVKRTIAGAGRAPSLEIISGVTLAVLGLWLLWRGLRRKEHVHNEGILVGVLAGLIPCPLTLFTMFLAQSRGVPELGYAFAVTMMLGVALTLSAVAITTAFARNWLLGYLSKHGNSTVVVVRGLDVLTGLLLLFGGIVRAIG